MANTDNKDLHLDQVSLQKEIKKLEDLQKENKAANAEIVANAITLLKDAESTFSDDLKDLSKRQLKKFEDGDVDIDNKADRDNLIKLLQYSEESTDFVQLLMDLNMIEEEAHVAQNSVVKSTQNELGGVLSDLNDNGKIGGIRKENKYVRNFDKNTTIEADQKDIAHKIYALTELSQDEQDIVIDMASSGKYQGINFGNRMRKDYVAQQIGDGISENDAKASWSNIESTLKGAGLWDDLRKMNRFEKKSDRVETRVQRSREKNDKEMNLNEDAIQAMFDSLAVMYGKEVFANKLNARLQRAAKGMQNVDAGRIDFESFAEMNSIMQNADTKDMIKAIFVQELKFMDVGSLRTWLEGQPVVEKKETGTQAVELSLEEQKALDETADAIAAKMKDLSPEQQKLIKPWIAGAISSYFTGLGGGVAFDLKTKLIDAVVVGAGVSTGGVPGLMIDFNKSITFGKNKGGSLTINAGAANMIPFARMDLDKVLNGKALRQTLTAKAEKKMGVYAEVMGPYYGAGVKLIDTDYMAGVNKQADHIQESFNTMLSGIDAGTSREAMIIILKDMFKGANPEDIAAAANHILSGLSQGYTMEDIAATFAQAWENAGTKKASKKVDFRAEVGVGMLGAIPVLKAFVGLGFYRRSTIKEDKTNKAIAKQEEQAFAGAEKIPTGALLEKAKGFFAGYTVEEKGDLITVTQGDGATAPIYDALNIYIKGTDARVTDNAITFSKNSSVHMADLIHPDGRKDKSIYIGFSAADTGKKRELNAAVEGNPEGIKKLQKRIEGKIVTTEEVKSEKVFDLWETMGPKNEKGEYDQEFISFMWGALNRRSFIDITKTGNTNKLAYNKAFGDFINATTTMNDAAMQKALVDMENKMGGKSGITNVLNRWNTFDASHKLYAAKMIMQAASHSAKVDEILNDTDGKVQGRKGQLDTIGALLMDRGGHEAAFANAGFNLPKWAFDAIYDKAKNINKNTDVSIVGLANAVSLVGYYRRGLNPTVGVLGLGSVQIIDGKDYRQAADKNGGEFKAFMDTYMKSAEAQQQRAALRAIIDKQTQTPDGKPLSDAEYLTLVTTGKLEHNGATITLPSDFFKALNGPCANESYILNFGDLNIKSKTSKQVEKPTERFEDIAPDQTMAVDVVTGRQQSKKVNIGGGFTVKTETIAGKAPTSGTTTGENDHTSGTDTGDEGPIDAGEGASDIPGAGDIPGSGTDTPDAPEGPVAEPPSTQKTTIDGWAGMSGGKRTGAHRRTSR